MKEILAKILRPSRKWTDILVLAALLSAVMVTIGGILIYIPIFYKPVDQLFTNIASKDVDTSYFLMMYFSFIGIWILFVLFCLIPWNHLILKRLFFKKERVLVALIGFVLGFASNAICVLFSVLSGNIKLYFNEFNPVLFFMFLFVVMVQSGAEEIADRCYLYQKLRRRYKSPLVAIIGNSLFFMALHLGNPGLTIVSLIQIFAIGVVFSLFVYYYDCLWAAILFHTAWNFTQSIFFGLPNSGIVSKYSLFKLDAASAKSGLFYNIGFGVEGSIGSLIIIIGIILIILLLNRGKKEKNDLWDKKEA